MSQAKKSSAEAVLWGPLLTSQSVLLGKKRIKIKHNGDVYLLRITRQNKLILTKDTQV